MAVALAGAAALFFEIAVKSIRVFMPNLPIHPATRLVAWLALLVAVQFLSGMMLTIACLLTPFLGARVLRRGGHLIWRTRWLLLSLFVIFSWGVAGEPLWNGALPPTLEGLQEAAKHLGRMLLVLLAVAAFQHVLKGGEIGIALTVVSDDLAVDQAGGQVERRYLLGKRFELVRPVEA